MNKVISLKTLDEATGQDVFNQVVNHLLTQKEKRVGGRSNTVWLYGFQ